MKALRHLALGVAACGLLTASAEAQVTGTQIFKVDAGTTLAFVANDNLSRGLAYNSATGNLLVASRTGSNSIHVVNAATGAAIGSPFNATDITGGTLVLMKVRVDGDGRIYANNLSGSAASTFKMYRWASEASGLANDVRSLVFERVGGSSYGYRVGDSMDVTGAGAAVKIIAVGSKGGADTVNNIVVLTDPENDGTFVDAEVVPVTPFPVGIPNIAYDSNDTNIAWYKKSETTDDSQIIDINLTTGADGPGTNQDVVMGTAGDADVTTGGPIDVATINGTKYFAVGPSATAASSSEPLRAKIFEENAGTAGWQTGPLQGTAINANANGSGDVVLLPDGRLFVLATNNSLSGWQFSFPSANVQDWNLHN
ncbi:MAG: hypothetical protein KF858_06985 [Candidatus Sumerlaeia bacterium]|nr:hypothetical protein [Candidatus Sumerlaeia bacterium]